MVLMGHGAKRRDWRAGQELGYKNPVNGLDLLQGVIEELQSGELHVQLHNR